MTNTFKVNSFNVVSATSSRKSDILIVNYDWDYWKSRDLVYKFNDTRRHKRAVETYYKNNPHRVQWIINDIKTKWKNITKLEYGKDYTKENGIIKLK